MKYLKSSLLFGGGLATGFLLSSYKNPGFLKRQKKRAEIVVERMNQLVKEKTERLREINQRLKNELTHPLPDLYSATESFFLEDDDLIYD